MESRGIRGKIRVFYIFAGPDRSRVFLSLVLPLSSVIAQKDPGRFG